MPSSLMGLVEHPWGWSNTQGKENPAHEGPGEL